MRILLVRHGESEGNVDEQAYITIGDSRIGLTEKGWEQAEGTGIFLKKLYKDTGTKEWPRIFCSSYPRALQTLGGIHSQIPQDLFEGKLKIYEDVRLTEQCFGALAHLTYHDDEETKHIAELLTEFSKQAKKAAPLSARLPFGESPKDIILHTKNFIDGTLKRDFDEGSEDLLIVCHGAVIKAFLMNWFHLPMNSWGELKLPSNGDVIAIEGGSKNWSVTKIYDGTTAKEVSENPIENISHICPDTLPQKPEFK